MVSVAYSQAGLLDGGIRQWMIRAGAGCLEWLAAPRLSGQTLNVPVYQPDPLYEPAPADLAFLWSAEGTVEVLADRETFIEYWSARLSSLTYRNDHGLARLTAELRDRGGSVPVGTSRPVPVRVNVADAWKGGAAEVTVLPPHELQGRTVFVLAACVTRPRPSPH